MTIPAWKDATFNTSQKSLVPIIWNHGFFSSNGEYQVTMMELASHGHLCISLNDKTGNTCCYTESPDGNPVHLNNIGFKGDEGEMIAEGKSQEVYDRLSSVLDPRVDQVVALIDELEAGEFVKTHLGSDIPIDMDRLCVGGHSHGGAVTCKVALKDKRIKAALPCDPFFSFAHPDSNIE
jgi:cephalosporin-C deacetylase-like acetyl esterase